MYHAPPPPKKEPPPNIEHVLLSFGRNTFRVELGFGKLNKHKNKKKLKGKVHTLLH